MAKGKKTGGRTAGTPNKRTAAIREVVTNLIEEYSGKGQMMEDLAELDAKDRLMVVVRLAEYVIPKLQSTTLDVAAETKKTIEDRLIELTEEDDEDEE